MASVEDFRDVGGAKLDDLETIVSELSVLAAMCTLNLLPTGARIMGIFKPMIWVIS
jgi:hypothetical protein